MGAHEDRTNPSAERYSPTQTDITLASVTQSAGRKAWQIMSSCEKLQDSVRCSVLDFLRSPDCNGVSPREVTDRLCLEAFRDELTGLRRELFERWLPLVSAFDLKPFVS